MIPALVSLALSAADGAAAIVERANYSPENGTTPDSPRESPYGYTPNLASCIAFLTIFSLLTLAHLGLAIRYRYWSAIVTMGFGGILEVIGWAGRLWSHYETLKWSNFIMQIVCLILGPVFFSAWTYTLMGMCIRQLGSQYSLIGSNLYLAVFVTGDIISLILQATGGGGAAINAMNYVSTQKNTHTMFVGIIFQLAIMTLFTILAVDFMVRVVWDKPYPAQRWKLLDIKCRRRSSISTEEPKDELEGGAAEALGTNHIVTRDSGPSLSPANVTPSASGERPYGKSQASSTTEGKSQANSKSGSEDTTEQSSPPEPSAPLDPRRLRKAQLLLLGVAWATLMIYIRCIYRSIELSEGWSGRIITTERYFIWLDGLMMVLCMLGLAVSHPGFLLPRRSWGRPGPE